MERLLLRADPNSTVEIACWGAKPPAKQIVLLHEGLGSVSTWRDFPEQLTRGTGLGVIAYSRQGYGRSSPLTDLYNLDYLQEEAERVAYVLDGLNVEQAYLLGHSDGASIALLAAGLLPDRILGVLAEAPHLYVEAETIAAVRAVGSAWDRGPLQVALGRHHDRPEPIFQRWHSVWTSEVYAERFDIRENLPLIRCPVIAVQGTEDAFASSKQLADIKELVCDVKVIWLDGCGHEPHRARPQTIIGLAKALHNKVERSTWN